MAISLRASPSPIASLIRSTMKRASSCSLNPAYSEIGSPSLPSVHSSLPMRPALLVISALAALRMVAVER